MDNFDLLGRLLTLLDFTDSVEKCIPHFNYIHFLSQFEGKGRDKGRERFFTFTFSFTYLLFNFLHTKTNLACFIIHLDDLEDIPGKRPRPWPWTYNV